MSHMTLQDFEARYRADPDPWSYETSAYERAKYAATIRACGAGPYRRGLELGSSIGVLSAQLAPLCGELVTVDAAPTAVATARRRLAAVEGVWSVLGAVPDAIPHAHYDLVVASEILYYLEPDALTATLARLRALTEPGARLVSVHWRPAGAERPFTAQEIRDRLLAEPWLVSVDAAQSPEYLLDVLVRQ